MLDRIQKPFMTVDTGEAYQPLRLTYDLYDSTALIAALNQINCLTKNAAGDSWNWYWQAESEDLHFESLDSFQKNPAAPVRLGTLLIKHGIFYISLPSFKRACLAVPFFHRLISQDVARIHHVDFINKVFALDERLPQAFVELFKEDELQAILKKRNADYEKIQERCEHAASVDEALAILKEYTESESKKRLPFAERYLFDFNDNPDPEIIFLSFYIFLRGRELVAIKRWFGETEYSLADAAEETVEQVFGGMDIDILE
jgi:hypothetical protein